MNPFRNWAAPDFEHHAEEFRLRARDEFGIELDFSPATVSDLESFIASRFAPGSADDNSMLIVGMGCYLGEVVIRRYGGSWRADEEHFHSPAVVIRGKLHTHTFPLSRVWRRFEYGPDHSLVAYYDEVERTISRF